MAQLQLHLPVEITVCVLVINLGWARRRWHSGSTRISWRQGLRFQRPSDRCSDDDMFVTCYACHTSTCQGLTGQPGPQGETGVPGEKVPSHISNLMGGHSDLSIRWSVCLSIWIKLLNYAHIHLRLINIYNKLYRNSGNFSVTYFHAFRYRCSLLFADSRGRKNSSF